MEKIRYFLKEGFRNIWTNLWMTFASVGILIICLLLLGTSLLALQNLNKIIGQLENTNQIMVYIQKSVTHDELLKLEDNIKSLDNVKNCTFVPRQNMYNKAKKELGEQNVLLTGIDSNVFDDAFQIKVVDMSQYSATADTIQKMHGIKYVRQDAGLATVLTRVQHIVEIVGIWLFIILTVLSLFIISNTIKLAMFSRKREINIMKFVGATDGFIRIPFVIEGVIIGLLSGGIALILQWYIYEGLMAQALNVLPSVHMVDFSSVLWYMCPGFFLCGMAVATLASSISVRKYLNV